MKARLILLVNILNRARITIAHIILALILSFSSHTTEVRSLEHFYILASADGYSFPFDTKVPRAKYLQVHFTITLTIVSSALRTVSCMKCREHSLTKPTQT